MLPSEVGLLSLPLPRHPVWLSVSQAHPRQARPPPTRRLPLLSVAQKAAPCALPAPPPGSADLSAVLFLLQPLVRMVTAFELSAAMSGGGSAPELGPAWSLWGLQCFSTKPSYLDRSNKTTWKLERNPGHKLAQPGPLLVSVPDPVSLVKPGRWCRSC